MRRSVHKRVFRETLYQIRRTPGLSRGAERRRFKADVRQGMVTNHGGFRRFVEFQYFSSDA